MKRIFGLLVTLVLILSGCEKELVAKGGLDSTEDSEQYFTAVEYLQLPQDKYYNVSLMYTEERTVIAKTGYLVMSPSSLPAVIPFETPCDLQPGNKFYYYSVYSKEKKYSRVKRECGGSFRRGDIWGRDYLEFDHPNEGIRVRIYTKNMMKMN